MKHQQNQHQFASIRQRGNVNGIETGCACRDRLKKRSQNAPVGAGILRAGFKQPQEYRSPGNQYGRNTQDNLGLQVQSRLGEAVWSKSTRRWPLLNQDPMRLVIMSAMLYKTLKPNPPRIISGAMTR